MKLLGSNTSPYTRKVRLVLLEKGLPHEYLVDPPREPGSLVPKVNPLGRIPTLVLDDGSILFDSPVICEHLDALAPSPRLLPTDPAARLRVKRWEALADGLMDAAVAVRVEQVRPPERQDPSWIALHQRAVDRSLAWAAAELAGREWCEGDALSLADLALAAALGYLDLRQPERDWRAAHPALAAFAARLWTRPSLQATRPG
jgi:glutathione S-transferase